MRIVSVFHQKDEPVDKTRTVLKRLGISDSQWQVSIASLLKLTLVYEMYRKERQECLFAKKVGLSLTNTSRKQCLQLNH